MQIDVSTGEVIDKYTILKIKSERISDEDKLKNIIHEKELLSKTITSEGYKLSNDCIKHLYLINGLLWDVEDRLREKERIREFNDDFTLLARFVYVLNDRRAEIKREINLAANSKIVEEKSYQQY